MNKRSDPEETSNRDDTREQLRCNCIPDDIRENKEDLTLVWLDEHINDSIEFMQTFNKVHESNDYILLYTDPQRFIDCIQSITNENIFLIISHHMSKTTLPCVQSMHTVISIFIYSINNTQCEIDSNQYSNDVIICNDQSSFIEAIQKNVYLFSKQTVTFSLFNNTKESSFRDLAHNPASFLWFQLLLDVFKQLPQTTEAKEQMIEACQLYYQNNNSYLKQIQEFADKYKSSDAIHWYTKSGFLYRLMNKAFRIDDIYFLYLLRFYIIDLCKQIQLVSENVGSSSSIIQLYRGRPIRKQELQILKANVGKLVSPNGFFSTTKDYEVALLFSGEDNARAKSTLFILTIDQTKIATGTILAADVEQFSNYPQEKEVLFGIGSTFRIEDITYNPKLKKWFIQMTAADDGLAYVQEHINSMRNDLAETNPTRLFGKLLIDMGQYSKAEKYYQLVLKTLPKDHDDFPSLYHGLGYTHYVRDQYIQALEYDNIAYAIRKQTLPENHLDIARSSLNLGCDYVGSGDHNTAKDLLMEALRIREWNYFGTDHANIAIVLAAIGDNYTHLCDYQNAYHYLTRALEMLKRVSPAEHADIARTLIKFGYFFEKQGVYNRAIEYYHSAHSMAAKIMPPEHPRLQKYFEDIIELYKKMNSIDTAVLFCEEKLSLQRELLGEDHSNIARIYEILGDLTIDNKQKLLNYHRALNIWQKCDPSNKQGIDKCQAKINAIQDFA